MGRARPHSGPHFRIDQIADKASQTITVVGEVSEKGGAKMVAIHEIVKR